MNIIEQKVCQNEQKVIQCDRCSNIFANMTNLRRHFNNKNVCKAILKDISIEELKEKYKVKKGCYKCENCGKEYKSKSGKYKHKSKCLLNIAIIEKNDKIELKNELEIVKKENEELQKQLICKTGGNNINSNTINNSGYINTNNNVVINVNNYGQEKEMTKKEITRIIKVAMRLCNDIRGNPWDAFNYVLQQIHFNPNYPENHNLKLTNIRSPIMDVYTNDKWKKVPFTEQIKLIIESLMEFIEDNQDKINFSSNYWEELYNKLDEYFSNGDNKKYYQKVETSLKCKLFNETQDISHISHET
jgi:hypothetical protein